MSYLLHPVVLQTEDAHVKIRSVALAVEEYISGNGG